jgi:hypothetical protein
MLLDLEHYEKGCHDLDKDQSRCGRPYQSEQRVLEILVLASCKRGEGINELFDCFPPSPSPTFIGRLHTPHTPRLDLRGTADFACPGAGP